MRAYQNDPELKHNLLIWLDQAKREGRIVQGHYWERYALLSTPDRRRGSCGCLIGNGVRDMVEDNHRVYSDRYGVPIELACLFDRMFENLSLEDAIQFTLDVHEVILVGADLSQVFPTFLLHTLIDPQHGLWQLRNDAEKQKTKQAAALLHRALIGDPLSTEEWQVVLRVSDADAKTDGAARITSKIAAWIANTVPGEAETRTAYFEIWNDWSACGLVRHWQAEEEDVTYPLKSDTITSWIIMGDVCSTAEFIINDEKKKEWMHWLRDILLNLLREVPIPSEDTGEKGAIHESVSE